MSDEPVWCVAWISDAGDEYAEVLRSREALGNYFRVNAMDMAVARVSLAFDSTLANLRIDSVFGGDE